jgi:cytochrome P450
LICHRPRSILHDETLYPSPFTFLPDRFLNEKGRLSTSDATEAVNSAFGFGRRICPGLYLAENSVFLGIATILTVFDISRAVDEMGREVVPEVEYDGFIR